MSSVLTLHQFSLSRIGVQMRLWCNLETNSCKDGQLHSSGGQQDKNVYFFLDGLSL